MAKIASGLDEKHFFSKPRIFTNINSTSPLKHDWPVLYDAIRFANKNQPVVGTPITLAGAMSPVTIAGSFGQAFACDSTPPIYKSRCLYVLRSFT